MMNLKKSLRVLVAVTCLIAASGCGLNQTATQNNNQTKQEAALTEEEKTQIKNEIKALKDGHGVAFKDTFDSFYINEKNMKISINPVTKDECKYAILSYDPSADQFNCVTLYLQKVNKKDKEVWRITRIDNDWRDRKKNINGKSTTDPDNPDALYEQKLGLCLLGNEYVVQK